MRNKTREILFLILLFGGIILLIIPIFGVVQMSVFVSPGSEGVGPNVEFTGIHATMLTIGFLLIIAAFVFKYKKFPKLV